MAYAPTLFISSQRGNNTTLETCSSTVLAKSCVKQYRECAGNDCDDEDDDIKSKSMAMMNMNKKIKRNNLDNDNQTWS